MPSMMSFPSSTSAKAVSALVTNSGDFFAKVDRKSLHQGAIAMLTWLLVTSPTVIVTGT